MVKSFKIIDRGGERVVYIVRVVNIRCQKLTPVGCRSPKIWKLSFQEGKVKAGTDK